jgi:hypothetical protein
LLPAPVKIAFEGLGGTPRPPNPSRISGGTQRRSVSPAEVGGDVPESFEGDPV